MYPESISSLLLNTLAFFSVVPKQTELGLAAHFQMEAEGSKSQTGLGNFVRFEYLKSRKMVEDISQG